MKDDLLTEDEILSPEEISKQLKTLIDSLSKCEKKKRNCKKCRLRNDGCLKFIRDSVAVALQFILIGIEPIKPKKIEVGMYR